MTLRQKENTLTESTKSCCKTYGFTALCEAFRQTVVSLYQNRIKLTKTHNNTVKWHPTYLN